MNGVILLPASRQSCIRNRRFFGEVGFLWDGILTRNFLGAIPEKNGSMIAKEHTIINTTVPMGRRKNPQK